jgi:hypothetical protein
MNPLFLLIGAGLVYLYISSQDKKTAEGGSKTDSGVPSPLWSGKASTTDLGGTVVTVLDEPARTGILRALLRDDIVAMDAKNTSPLWSAGLRHGVGGLKLTEAQRGKYTAAYKDPAMRGLQFVAQALQSGRDVYVPIEWAKGDLTKPLPLDPERSADLYAAAQPLDPMQAKYWALLVNAPRGTKEDLERAKPLIQSMLTAPGKEFELALLGMTPPPNAATAGRRYA